MTLDEFRTSSAAPEFGPLAALWHDAHGDWALAHELVQDDSSAEAAWVHAYLHRKEGDAGNARYWYSVAGKSEFKESLDAERDAIVLAFQAR
jgi:hypothetical protein